MREEIDELPPASRNWTMTFAQVFRIWPVVLGCALMGCHPKEVTPLQRKEAASVASEAEFALTLKDFARAETLYAKAATLDPGMADYWMSLGSTRKHLGQISGAKSAYESAIKAQQAAYKKDPSNAQLLLDQVYVLALLGRMDEARAMLQRAMTEHGNDAQVKNFTARSLDAMVVTPDFKALAL